MLPMTTFSSCSAFSGLTALMLASLTLALSSKHCAITADLCSFIALKKFNQTILLTRLAPVVAIAAAFAIAFFVDPEKKLRQSRKYLLTIF